MARSTGLELLDTAVRVVEIEGTPKKYKVLGAAEKPIAGGAHADPDAVSQAVRQAFKEARAHRDQVVVGLPTSEATLREILIPFTDPEQIRKVIKFESEGHLHGVDIEDVVVDFQKVGEIGPRSRVLIIAVKKETIRNYLQILNKAGIDPHQIDLDAAALFSLSRLLPEIQEHENQAQVILDLGEISSTVIVSQGEHLRMARCIRMGADSLARSISAELGVEREEARTITHQLLQVGDPFQVAGEAPVTSSTATELQVQIVRDKQTEFEKRLVTEIGRSLSSIQLDGKLSAIWLTGPASTAPGLEEALQEAFGVSVAHLDTLQPAEHKLPENAALWVGTASGLALKGLGHDPLGLDFRQEELRFTRTFERIQVPLTLAALFLFLGLAFLSIDTFLEIRARKDLINRCADQAVYDLEKILVEKTVRDPDLREIMGFKSIAEVEKLVPAVQKDDKARWVNRVLARLRPRMEHIQETFGIEVGGETEAGPETRVLSALERLEAFRQAFARAKPKLGKAMINTLQVSPREIRFDWAAEKTRGWSFLARELEKIPGFKEADRGQQQFTAGLNEFKGSRVTFESEE